MTQDEKIERTRHLLSAPPREYEIEYCQCEKCLDFELNYMPKKPKRIQPEPNEIGYT
jgi:hypothetical protein